MIRRIHQRGVALIIAMTILALGASITAAMLWQRGLALDRVKLVLYQQQAYQYDLGAEAWVERILFRSRGKPDTLGSPWAQHLPPLPVTGGALQGSVVDLQGRFNLNNLRGHNGKIDPRALAVLKRLLTVLGINPNITHAIADWEDANASSGAPGGAESGYYATLDPPYAPANGPFVSITTLRLVKGITPAIYARLAPYVSALPIPTPVNINTASAPVIAAVVPGLGLSRAEAIVRRRSKNGFSSISRFQDLTQRKIAWPLALRSRFFLLRVTTTIGTTRLSLYSVIYRNTQGMTQSIARSFTPI